MNRWQWSPSNLYIIWPIIIQERSFMIQNFLRWLFHGWTVCCEEEKRVIWLIWRWHINGLEWHHFHVSPRWWHPRVRRRTPCGEFEMILSSLIFFSSVFLVYTSFILFTFLQAVWVRFCKLTLFETWFFMNHTFFFILFFFLVERDTRRQFSVPQYNVFVPCPSKCSFLSLHCCYCCCCSFSSSLIALCLIHADLRWAMVLFLFVLQLFFFWYFIYCLL